jgi:hypothetical protein
MTCNKNLRCSRGPLCGHRAIVDAYRDERLRQEIVAENATLGYPSEYADWLRDCPLITFHQWLKGNRHG